MKEYLDSILLELKDGPIQDIHWPMGTVGYFPSYTLGALNAAQLFTSMKRTLPSVMQDIEALKLDAVFDWLNTLFAKGSYLSYDELMTEATGETLNASYFLEHVRRRYLSE